MELHLSVIVIVVHAEALVFGQDVQQLPLALVHKDTFILPELLRASHQSDVNVINCGSNRGQKPWQRVSLQPASQ